jgi:hypothetical protein
MFRFSLRTLIVVMLLGGPALAGLWWLRSLAPWLIAGNILAVVVLAAIWCIYQVLTILDL